MLDCLNHNHPSKHGASHCREPKRNRQGYHSPGTAAVIFHTCFGIPKQVLCLVGRCIAHKRKCNIVHLVLLHGTTRSTIHADALDRRHVEGRRGNDLHRSVGRHDHGFLGPSVGTKRQKSLRSSTIRQVNTQVGNFHRRWRTLWWWRWHFIRHFIGSSCFVRVVGDVFFHCHASQGRCDVLLNSLFGLHSRKQSHVAIRFHPGEVHEFEVNLHLVRGKIHSQIIATGTNGEKEIGMTVCCRHVERVNMDGGVTRYIANGGIRQFDLLQNLIVFPVESFVVVRHAFVLFVLDNAVVVDHECCRGCTLSFGTIATTEFTVVDVDPHAVGAILHNKVNLIINFIRLRRRTFETRVTLERDLVLVRFNAAITLLWPLFGVVFFRGIG
mmetsp:Transcript_24121/g.45882  ORF Transcript_24121/g.45882 Transcript_24121/m.45882 type:complete len:383 (-) Transcript_24121:396-1544(-)